MSETSANMTPVDVLQHVAAILGRSEGQGLIAWERDVPPEIRRQVQQALFTISRRRASLDWVLGRFARHRIRPLLRHVLWWGICQVVWLDGLPRPIAVDACVRFVRSRLSRREAGFVNAVLRGIVRSLDAEGPEALWRGAPEWVRLDLGEGLWSRWQERFSAAELEQLAAVLARPAPLVVRARRQPGIAAPASVHESLVALPPPEWAPEARLYRCEDPAGFFASSGWKQGLYYVQDPSTLLAPALLAVRPGETAADLCAAPGGKSMLLAEGLAGQGMLLCMDRSVRRLRRLRENLSVADTLQVLAGDAARPPLAPGGFDAVLLDVPCSNTGVIRRRPDVRWNVSAEKCRDLAELQLRILSAAATLLRPEGRLLYSTCSIEPEENSGVVAAFLETSHGRGFQCVAERQLLPTEEHDGAFACLLQPMRK